jgi:hypothetical protein
MVIGAYLDLGLNFYDGYKYSNAVEVKASTYVVLAGIAIGSGLVLWGFRSVDAEHASRGDVPIVRAVYKFAGLLVVLALVAGAVFALATFMSSFDMGMGGASSTLTGRLLGVYLPIVLDAALVVFVLLSATIWRKSSAVEGASAPGMSATQKALAIGYAVPVIGTALAIIIGLVVYDFQKQALQNWTWVVIQLIIGTSIVFGTRAAAKARSAKPVVRAPKVAGAAGAVRLNYVLSLVFAGVVSFMSFGFSMDAIASLGTTNCDSSGHCTYALASVSADWWVNKMIPAALLLVLVQVATYVVIVSRNKEVASA